MEREGKYIYCIIQSSQDRNFGPIGVGDRNDEVLTIGYKDLNMVVSNHSLTKFVVNRDNMIAHEKVIEKVMEEYNSVLPVRFGTIASNPDEIRNLLDDRYREFKDYLRYMDNKIELSIKGLWKNMDSIFNEVVVENIQIKNLKEKIRRRKEGKNIKSQVEIGKMVEKALIKKKEIEAEKIVDVFRRTAIEHNLNKTIGDEMFINAAFLVDKGREKEFDNIMDDLSEKYNERIKFMYSGPLPVFNFVNITIYPQEWEK